MKKANKLVSQITRSGIAASYEDNMNCILSLESTLTSKQEDLEKYFRENNIPVHHNWVFSKENRETIAELTNLIKDCTKDLKSIPYYKLWQYCICFMLMQKLARRLIWTVSPIEPTPQMLSCTNALKYYCKYSVAIYGKLLTSLLIESKYSALFASESDEIIFCKYVKIREIDLLYSQLVSRKYVPCHTVSIDLYQKAIVVSIRGTMSLFDCMTDLKGVYEDYIYTDAISGEVVATGQVHSGIMQSAINVSIETLPFVISCMEEWPDFSVVLVGHSLGAGTASLLCLLWLSRLEFATKDLKAYVYGPPPVLSSSLNCCLVDVVYSCIYGNDLISRLSLGSIKDLAEMIKYQHRRELADPTFNASAIASSWLNGKHSDNLNLVQVYRSMKTVSNAEKLVPPGNILQLYRASRHIDYLLISGNEKEQGIIGKFLPNHFYSELVIDKESFLDHMPNAYEEAIGEFQNNGLC